MKNFMAEKWIMWGWIGRNSIYECRSISKGITLYFSLVLVINEMGGRAIIVETFYYPSSITSLVITMVMQPVHQEDQKKINTHIYYMKILWKKSRIINILISILNNYSKLKHTLIRVRLTNSYLPKIVTAYLKYYCHLWACQPRREVSFRFVLYTLFDII